MTQYHDPRTLGEAMCEIRVLREASREHNRVVKERDELRAKLAAALEKLQPILSGLERLKHLTPPDIGDTWNDQYVEIVECLEPLYAAAGAAPNDVLEGHAHAGLLEAFDAYARQFTYNSHPAKPEHFPKSFIWFSAGYSAAGAAMKGEQP